MDIHPVQLLLVLEEQERRLFPVIVPAKKRAEVLSQRLGTDFGKHQGEE